MDDIVQSHIEKSRLESGIMEVRSVTLVAAIGSMFSKCIIIQEATINDNMA
jgi:hypothetical protein